MAIVLKNKHGMEVHVLQTGAVIQRLLVPDRDGNLGDIVLGYDDEETYAEPDGPYFGAVVGRVANRIANGQFTLLTKTYHLPINNPPNCLHGGLVGFSRSHWKVLKSGVDPDQGQFVKLGYVSVDGEEGFPALVRAYVTYSLTDGNQLRVEMSATTTAPTPINLAQHSYFNLNGHDSKDNILNHVLHLPTATHYTPTNDVQIPTGKIAPVKNTAMDFTTAHKIGDDVQDVQDYEITKGYDHNYVLFPLKPGATVDVRDRVDSHGQAFKQPKLVATLGHGGSGRGMRVYTTAPGVQLYTGNFLDGSVKGKAGVAYQQYGGVCLETQGFPDAVNHPTFPPVVITPGHEYKHTLEYEFFILD